MGAIYSEKIEKSARIPKLIEQLFEKMPEIEADRAVLLTESYKATEGEPIALRRAKAFYHICDQLPIVIRPLELVVGSNTKSARSCQVFPEYSFSWLEEEFDTLATRSADPFYISEESKKALREVLPYWKGKTTSELATAYMADETLLAIEHNIFTPGNYFYNGIGHLTVDYGKVLRIGFDGIRKEAETALEKLNKSDSDYAKREQFLKAVIISARAICRFAERYAELALKTAKETSDETRKAELLKIAENCKRVPAKPATSFYEACQSFWFVQLLLQTESNGHSISPGRFDQYMYPYFKEDFEKGLVTREFAQELVDCLWVKFNDISKVRDLASAEGFAGYGTFQNLIVGGQDAAGKDVTNDMSYMCMNAVLDVYLPQPSFSVRVWNGTPHEFMLRAAEITRTGIGLPAYYNDEVIIQALQSRGLTLEDAREYNIIGCVEPQKAGKTDGWHDAAFFNMCRPLELVFSQGVDKGVQIGPRTKDVSEMTSFEEFYDAYKTQMNYFIELLVNADNAIDYAQAERCPLPFQSSMVEDCIGRGKSLQEGGAIYNFTGPQGFGIANMADALYTVKNLVFKDKKFTMSELKEALENNYGLDMDALMAEKITKKVAKSFTDEGKMLSREDILTIYNTVVKNTASEDKKQRYGEILKEIEKLQFC